MNRKGLHSNNLLYKLHNGHYFTHHKAAGRNTNLAQTWLPHSEVTFSNHTRGNESI